MKKILISNNCLAASVYKDCLKIPQPSPFCWNIIQQEDFIKLIENIDTINFLNFKVVFDTLCQEYYVLIDGLVKVYYTHYKYDDKAETPYHGFVSGHGDMIYSKDIIGFISDTYLRRVNRLIEAKETEDVEYIFYYDVGCFQPWAEPIESYIQRKYDELSELVKVESRHTICVGHWGWDFLDELIPKNENILYFPKPSNPDGTIIDDEGSYMYDNYFKSLME